MTDNDTWYLDSNKLSSADKKKRRIRNLDYKNSFLDILFEAVRSEHDFKEDV